MTNEIAKRRAIGALALVGLAFVVVSLLPGVNDVPDEPGVKVVVIDLDDDGKPLPPGNAAILNAPPASVAAAAAPVVEDVEDAGSTDSLPDPAAEPMPEPPPAASTPVPAPKPAATPESKPATAPPAPPKPAAAPAKPPPVAAPAPATKPAAPAAKPSTPAAIPPPVAASTSGRWFVQVGGFADVNNAHALQARLKSAGQASIIAPTESAQGTLYRVRAGPYATREAALSAQQSLRGNGFGAATLVAEP